MLACLCVSSCTTAAARKVAAWEDVSKFLESSVSNAMDTSSSAMICTHSLVRRHVLLHQVNFCILSHLIKRVVFKEFSVFKHRYHEVLKNMDNKQ